MNPAPHSPMPGGGHDTPAMYEIRFAGHLGERWRGWFGCMTISPEANGETLLTGTIIDQAALHGILARVRDLGLVLISIVAITPDPDATPPPRSTNHRKDAT